MGPRISWLSESYIMIIARNTGAQTQKQNILSEKIEVKSRKMVYVFGIVEPVS